MKAIIDALIIDGIIIAVGVPLLAWDFGFGSIDPVHKIDRTIVGYGVSVTVISGIIRLLIRRGSREGHG